MGDLQDPQMEVLYHIRPYFPGIFPYIGLKKGLIYGRYLHFRFLKWPLIYGMENLMDKETNQRTMKQWRI